MSDARTSINSRSRLLHSLEGLLQVGGEVLPEIRGSIPSRKEFLVEGKRTDVLGAQGARRLDALG